jgi:NADPH:quinone reductase-like Zn-dependent oxidoreductase
MFGAVLSSLFSRKRAKIAAQTWKSDDLTALVELIEAGKVTPIIDRTYPLTEAAQAVSYVAEGHARGKVFITV